MKNKLNKKGIKKRNLFILLLTITYLILLIVFAISLFRLPKEYTKMEKEYIIDVKSALDTNVQQSKNENELKNNLTSLVKDYPMEIIVMSNENVVFATTSQTMDELRDQANDDITLMQTQNEYVVNNVKYTVFYNLYHIQGNTFVTHLVSYQIIIIGIAIFIILVLTTVVFVTLFKTLSQIKMSLKKVENYDFDDIIEKETNDEINENLRRFVANLNKNIKVLSRDFTELEQALQIEQERLANTISVSSAFVHDLKTPLHRTLLMNERMLKKDNSKDEIVKFNIEETEKIIFEINEILKLMDENIYDFDKQYEVIDFVELLNNTYKMFVPIIQKKRSYFELDIPEQLYISANVPTLKLLLHNILTNATKYVEEDTKIICRVEEKEETFIFYCENETSLYNIQRIKNSEHLFSKDIVTEAEHQYSSGKGLFLIKELTHALEGDYHLTIKGNIVIITLELPMNIEVI